MNPYFIDLTKCKFIVWVQIYCTPIAVAFSLTQKYCNLYLTKGPISISFHCLCWLYAEILSIPQLCQLWTRGNSRFPCPDPSSLSPDLDAKMLLCKIAMICKSAKILQSAIFLQLVDFNLKREQKQVNKPMQVQKYCLFLDF